MQHVQCPFAAGPVRLVDAGNQMHTKAALVYVNKARRACCSTALASHLQQALNLICVLLQPCQLVAEDLVLRRQPMCQLLEAVNLLLGTAQLRPACSEGKRATVCT